MIGDFNRQSLKEVWFSEEAVGYRRGKCARNVYGDCSAGSRIFFKGYRFLLASVNKGICSRNLIDKSGSSTESVGKTFIKKSAKTVDSVENPRKSGFPTEPSFVATANEVELEKSKAKKALKYIAVNGLCETLDASYSRILRRRHKSIFRSA